MNNSKISLFYVELKMKKYMGATGVLAPESIFHLEQHSLKVLDKGKIKASVLRC